MSVIKIKGYEVIVDDEDYEKVMAVTWYVTKKSNKRENGPYFKNDYQKAPNPYRGGYITLHRLVIGATNGQLVDHINGNTLDNRKNNLRIANKAGNAQNMEVKNRFGNIRGIDHIKRSNSIVFQVMVKINGRRKYIGVFHNEMVAEYHLMKSCNELHGEFSRYARYRNEVSK